MVLHCVITTVGVRSTSNEIRQVSSSSSSPRFNVVSPNPMFNASLALRDLASNYAATTNSNFTEEIPTTSNHGETGHMSACEVCNLLVEATEMEDHLYKIHGRGSALCPLCHRFFKNKNSLKVHKSMYHRKPRDSTSTENETSSLFRILPPPPLTDDHEFEDSTNLLPEITFQEEKYSPVVNQQHTE